jgi:hypothetical protein
MKISLFIKILSTHFSKYEYQGFIFKVFSSTFSGEGLPKDLTINDGRDE